MLMKVRNFLRGSLMIDIKGASIERFLNLCAIHNVAFWDVHALDIDHFTAWVSVGGYASLRPYARKTGCRVHVCKKTGAPFLARNVTRRWALWLGVLLCMLTVYHLSGFVWTIEVRGCEQTTPQEILRLMERAGLKTGTYKPDCDLREIRNYVMTNADKLSYFTLNFKGTQAIIQVWERENPAEKPEEQPPCNVVSDLTGIVLRLRVRTGTAQVKEGDTVQPGDLIATGVIVNENDETQTTLIHAEAEADLRTWYTIRTAVPGELQVLQKEELVRERLYFLFGQRRFHLGLIENNTFSWYDKQIKTHYLHLQDNFRWPIGLEQEQIVLCKTQDAEVDRAALSDTLKTRMLDRLMASKPGAQLVQADFTLEQSSQGAWLGVLKVELVETTGQEVPIG